MASAEGVFSHSKNHKRRCSHNTGNSQAETDTKHSHLTPGKEPQREMSIVNTDRREGGISFLKDITELLNLTVVNPHDF